MCVDCLSVSTEYLTLVTYNRLLYTPDPTYERDMLRQSRRHGPKGSPGYGVRPRQKRNPPDRYSAQRAGAEEGAFEAF